MTEERKLWLSICNNDLKKLEACAESIRTETQRSVFLNWSEKVKWNIIFKLDKATRWGIVLIEEKFLILFLYINKELEK